MNDLRVAADSSSETVYSFLHDLKKEDKGLFETETLPSKGPGRPVLRYILTQTGIDFLAEQNVSIAQELNEFAFQEFPALRRSLRQGEHADASSNDLISPGSIEQLAVRERIDEVIERMTRYEEQLESLKEELRDKADRPAELGPDLPVYVRTTREGERWERVRSRTRAVVGVAGQQDAVKGLALRQQQPNPSGRTVRDQVDGLVNQMVERGIYFDEAIREFEKRFIKRVLDRANGNQSRAAQLLGIHRETLRKKIEEYKIDQRARRSQIKGD